MLYLCRNTTRDRKCTLTSATLVLTEVRVTSVWYDQMSDMNEGKDKLVDEIVNVELPALWRFALQLTRDKHDAEDLVQRTCVRSIEQCDQYNDSGKLKSWLFRIAHNIWRNELRSRAIRRRGDLLAVNPYGLDDNELESDNSTPEKSLELQQVVSAVEALPEGQRLVTQLVCVSGVSYAETASILDVAVGTVMSRLARARVSIGSQFLNDEPVNQPENPPRSLQPMPTNTVPQQ